MRRRSPRTGASAQPVVSDERSSGRDGHPARGGFLPPVPLPRRMWQAADSNSSIRCGSATSVTRTSRISDVHDEDRQHAARCASSRCEHDHPTPRGTRDPRAARHRLSRHAEGAGAIGGRAAPRPHRRRQHRETHMADPVLLFRYSALTFNGHRIHYDRDYVTKVEGLSGPGRPRPAAGDAARSNSPPASAAARRPTKFVYRGVNPLFDGSGIQRQRQRERRRP